MDVEQEQRFTRLRVLIIIGSAILIFRLTLEKYHPSDKNQVLNDVIAFLISLTIYNLIGEIKFRWYLRRVKKMWEREVNALNGPDRERSGPDTTPGIKYGSAGRSQTEQEAQKPSDTSQDV